MTDETAATGGNSELDPDGTEQHVEPGPPELRFAVAPLTHLEVRDPSGTHNDTWTMSGYAAVFNETTTLLNSKFVRLTESIDPGAFDRVLRDQGMDSPSGVVHFNLGHDMNRAVAATDVPAGQPGSLELRADKTGLYFMAMVPRDDPDGQAMAVKMRNGVIRQASFAFQIRESSYDFTETEDGPDVEHRTILDLEHLYDVCATPQGAYSSTVSGLRSYAAALGQPTDQIDPRLLGNLPVGGQQRQPDLGGASTVNPREAVAGQPGRPGHDALMAFRRERLLALQRKLR